MTDETQGIVELRPGQKINFITEGVQVTPFGERLQKEVKYTLTYEEILASFKKALPAAPRVAVPTDARKFNRFAALSQTALEKGTWSSGAAVDVKKVISDLVNHVKALPVDLLPFVTEKAKNHLAFIAQSPLVKHDQQNALKDFLAKFDVEEEEEECA